MAKEQKARDHQDMILVEAAEEAGTAEVAAVTDVAIQVVEEEVQVGHSQNQALINGKKEILVIHLNMF